MRPLFLFVMFAFCNILTIVLSWVIFRTSPNVPAIAPAATIQTPVATVQTAVPEGTQQNPSPALVTIPWRQLPENHEVYVTWSQIVALNQKPQPETVSYSTVQDAIHFGTPQWTLFRFRDGLYVRGYRIYNNESVNTEWFSSAKSEGVDDCRSETVPLSDLKALSGPPEITDGDSDNMETVQLPLKHS